VTVHDDLGRVFTLPAHPRRVLALAPSMSEMLFAVADTATIVARVPQHNYPAAVYRKPVVNNYPLNLEKLVLLKPDIFFTLEGISRPSTMRNGSRSWGFPCISSATAASRTCSRALKKWAVC
jgi:ABC-type Fe3+-hydroxamate transport system substrate-binding protein